MTNERGRISQSLVPSQTDPLPWKEQQLLPALLVRKKKKKVDMAAITAVTAREKENLKRNK